MLAAWILTIAGLLAAPSDGAKQAWVAVDSVDVLDEPDDGAFSTGLLRYKQQVTIRRDGPSGWVTLDPPSGAFSLIDAADIEELDDGMGRVKSRYATVRPGRDGARQPGPARITLRGGTLVRLLDRRPLVLRGEGETRTWLPIEPPAAEVRFVRASALERGRPPDRADTTPRDPQGSQEAPSLSPSRREPEPPPALVIDENFATAGSDLADLEVSPEMAQRLRRVGDRHRLALRRPMDQWELDSIEAEYRELASQAIPADRPAIEGRITQVHRQKAAAEAAKSLEALIAGSRSRDAKLDTALSDAMKEASGKVAKYDASGFLQSTSKRREGKRLYVLLGDDGAVICYLTTQAGVAMDDFQSRRVGIRGQGRYDEQLHARLVLARDVELLKADP